MRKLQILYRFVENVIGRNLVCRLGRWLYLGARREQEIGPNSNGEYALQEWLLSALDEIERKQVVLFDVGANRGDWTYSAMIKCRNKNLENWKIHAFEPAPILFEKLASRFSKQMEDSSIFVHKVALSSTDGYSSFYVTGDLTGTSSLVKNMEMVDAQEIHVETAKLDSFIAQYPVGIISLLKIDTEGNDFQVLKGAIATIKSGAIHIIQFEYNWRWLFQNNSLREVFQLVEGLDYQIGRLTTDAIEIHTQWHQELDRFIECNYVIVSKSILPRLPHRFMQFNRYNVATVRQP
jgi:FkbM family methyltransferase